VAKKKRKAPRKRAINQEQVVEQLRRYQRLLDEWQDEQARLVKAMGASQEKIKQYRKKVKYYTERLEASAGEAAKALRSIQLEG